MSLFSYLNFDNSSSSSTNSAGSAYTTALAQLTAAKAKLASSATSSTSTASTSSVSISASATIAAATKADAKKEPAELVADIRTALNAQYAKTGKGKAQTADLSELSPRAVATVALNSNGDFSKAEVLAAKQEMRSRDRASFFQATSSDFSLSSLEAYQSARLVSYNGMSVEERAVRGAKG